MKKSLVLLSSLFILNAASPIFAQTTAEETYQEVSVELQMLEKKEDVSDYEFIANIIAIVNNTKKEIDSTDANDIDKTEWIENLEKEALVKIKDFLNNDRETDNEDSTNVEISEDVPREYKNALKSAEQYLKFSAFSKEGLYNQLEFEGYPHEAAQYAVDTIDTDWNENALKSANQYLDFMSFSDSGLYDQLIYEGYTPEQAQYAIDNLD